MSAILVALTDNASVHVGDLAVRFAVSEATLRRDLALLEEQRLLTRTHGGALAHDVAYELPVRYRGEHHRQEKRMIARAAVRGLPKGPHVVAFTGGTTTSEVARKLANHEDLTVVTNALNIATDLVLHPRIKLIVVGGVSRPQSYELVGPWADHVISSINIGTAFVGVDGISARGGLTTHDEIEARTNLAMIEHAERVVVVGDSTKVGRTMLARISGLERVDELITDAASDPGEVDAIRATGVTVTIADVASSPDGEPATSRTGTRSGATRSSRS